MTQTQKKTAEAIVNLFETGEDLGDYSQVTLLAGDTGHLTYGRSQTTLGLQRCCGNFGAWFGARLLPCLPRFAAKDLSLDNDARLHNLLRASADDPVMRKTQDAFFDEVYWQRASREADRRGIASPL